MASFTLDDIRTAAEKKYGSTDIQIGDREVRLVNALRLPKERRQAVVALQKEMDEEGADQEALLARAIRLIARSDSDADALLEAVDGDLTILVEIFQRYSEGTQVGEASASDD